MIEPQERSGPKGLAPRIDNGRLLLVGARRQIRRLAGCLDEGPWEGLPVVGFVDVSGRGRQLVVHPKSNPVPILGRVDRLSEVVGRSRATDLVIALSRRTARRLRPQLAHLSSTSIRIHWVDENAIRADVLRSHPRWAVHRPPWPLFWGRAGKRLLDLVGAAIGLCLLTPLFLAIAVLIVLTDGWPVFYTQERVGQGGRPFQIWKFRSMLRDAEGSTGPIWASNQDERCTRIGRWLRKTNIDELPQLINVLKGEMSLVGPRPERPMFVDRFRVEVPDYEFRHAVPAGMTGWAQVHGWRGRTSLRKRVQYDLDYIRRWSFRLDLTILLMTVQHVVWGKTRWQGPPGRPEH